MRLKLLLVDDDDRFTAELARQLSSRHEIHVERDGDGSLLRVAELNPDLVLLDYRLEGVDGVRWLDSLRAQGHRTPVIIVSGYPDQKMAIDFMKRAVVGFLEKPFMLEELEAAIAQALNVVPAAEEFKLDREARCVRESGQRFELTPTEFKILEILVENEGRTVDRQLLIQKAMGREAVSRNALDTHIFNIKRKIPSLETKVRVVYGHGFIFDTKTS